MAAVSLFAHGEAAHAWGFKGHQVIALVAQSKLTTKAHAEVDRLLALEAGETLASISTWADEHRSPQTAPWHYVNFPRETCNYVPERDCPEGKCVVGAIERQVEILRTHGDEAKRLVALKYLVHFVGDVHQPLHAGYLDDKGGNTYQLQAFMRGSNLHSLWDSGLIKNQSLDSLALTTKLLAMAAPAGGSALNAANAAEESCRIVGAEGFYPNRKVGMDYIEKFTPVVEQRLRLAGERLASLLNSIFR